MPNPKQQEIPGTEAPRVPEIEEAADKYVDVRDKRMALTTKEVERRAVLVDAMKRNKLTVYRFDDHIVELESKDKVKVKNVHEDDEEE